MKTLVQQRYHPAPWFQYNHVLLVLQTLPPSPPRVTVSVTTLTDQLTKPTQGELQPQGAFRAKFCRTDPKNWGDNWVETLRVSWETWKHWNFNEFQVRVTTTELKTRFTQVLRTHHHPARAGPCWVPCGITPQIINTDNIAKAPYCILSVTTSASGKCEGVYFCFLFTNSKYL